MELSSLIFNEASIKKKLYRFDSPGRVTLKDEFFTPSAILFTIIPFEDKPFELVLIHRTDKGSKHAGEMSFPGGKFELEEDANLEKTALRECEEEIGVPRDKIRLLGCLNDFPTMSKFVITPFVGYIDKNQKLIKEEREVQEIVKVPIDFFVNTKNFREQAFDVEGRQFPVFYFNYSDKTSGKKYTIWGATAYMIVSFIELIYPIKLSKLNIQRFSIEEIGRLKNYILYQRQITKELK